MHVWGYYSYRVVVYVRFFFLLLYPVHIGFRLLEMHTYDSYNKQPFTYNVVVLVLY